MRFVYAWAPKSRDGKRVLAAKSEVVLGPGQQEHFQMSLNIPWKKKYSKKYTTFAILNRHAGGDDVLFETPVKIEYMKIKGRWR